MHAAAKKKIQAAADVGAEERQRKAQKETERDSWRESEAKVQTKRASYRKSSAQSRKNSTLQKRLPAMEQINANTDCIAMCRWCP